MTNTAEVLEIEANCAIKKVVGEGFLLETHISGERVSACQNVIDEANQHFFERGVEDVRGMQLHLNRVKAGEADDAFFRTIEILAHNIYGQSAILGFTLIAEMSAHMIASSGLQEVSAITRYRLIMHITQLLQLAFERRIRDAGGPQGEEMLAMLAAYLEGHA